MFTSVGIEHPAAAVMIINDPIKDFGRIQKLVRGGFMVRTRADANTVEARANDVKRLQAALPAGLKPSVPTTTCRSIPLGTTTVSG